MLVSLRLQHYRSYKDASFEFSPGVSIIVGPNASGKTNLLEAILVVCTGSSYRAKDSDLIELNHAWARISGQLDDEDRTVYWDSSAAAKTEKQFKVNTQSFKRLPTRYKTPIVLFEPEHLQLLQAGPDLRRDYLDNILESLRPGYSSIRRAYQRTLAQRNRLLKQPLPPARSELFVWNVRLAELGEKIAHARAQLVEEVNEEMPKLYQTIAGRMDNALDKYKPNFPSKSYSSSFLKVLDTTLDIDRERGFTGHGPHREDFMVSINGQNAYNTASRGEIRTVLLSLKIIELRLKERFYKRPPMLLLDDVFSELDGSRRKALTGFLQNYQTFITTTDADVVLHHLISSANIIPTV